MSKPPFKPKPGQIDYTNLRRAPVINCVVKYKDKILLVKRSPDMHLYPNYWNGISGFLDENKPIKDKVKAELKEEISLNAHHVLSIKQGKVFEQEAAEYNKTWIVHPILVEVDTDTITLDWEAQSYEWIGPGEIFKYPLLPGFDIVIKNFFKIFYAGGFLYNQKKESVLLHKRDNKTQVNPNKWGFFGGTNSGNETPEECFRRELREELAIEVPLERIKPLRDYFNIDRGVHRYVFFVESNARKSDMKLGEGADFDWIPLNAVLNYDLTTKTMLDLQFFIENKTEPKEK